MNPITHNTLREYANTERDEGRMSLEAHALLCACAYEWGVSIDRVAEVAKLHAIRDEILAQQTRFKRVIGTLSDGTPYAEGVTSPQPIMASKVDDPTEWGAKFEAAKVEPDPALGDRGKGLGDVLRGNAPASEVAADGEGLADEAGRLWAAFRQESGLPPSPLTERLDSTQRAWLRVARAARELRADVERERDEAKAECARIRRQEQWVSEESKRLRAERAARDALQAEVERLRAVRAICTVDVEAAAAEMALRFTDDFLSEPSARRDYLDILRKHTRTVAVEDVAKALEAEESVFPTKREAAQSLARAALRALGLAFTNPITKESETDMSVVKLAGIGRERIKEVLDRARTEWLENKADKRQPFDVCIDALLALAPGKARGFVLNEVKVREAVKGAILRNRGSDTFVAARVSDAAIADIARQRAEFEKGGAA